MAGLLVDKAGVDRMAEPTWTFPAEILDTASVFGRKVGLKDHGRFIKLVTAGHTPATRLKHPRTGVTQYFMTERDIEAFHARFVTLSTLSRETNKRPRILLVTLRRAGIAPFAPEGQDYGYLFLRSEVEPALL
ncbi:hypothetical protein ACW9UR_00130 [Halovulum sp. GXIMD14794]